MPPGPFIDWFPLWLSLRVAAISTAIALVVGLGLAWILANRTFRAKEVLDAAITLPLVLPPTVLGYYLLVLLGRASPIGHLYEWLFGGPLVFTWQAAVVASLFHSTPLLVKSARAAFESVDRSYERAARNLGATELRLFWRVTLPTIRWGVAYGVVLTTARALGEIGAVIVVSSNVAGSTLTLPLLVYQRDSQIGGQVTTSVYAAATELAVLSIAVLLVMTLFGSRRKEAR